jgi:DNA-binding CsgD family transcriptional regulator
MESLREHDVSALLDFLRTLYALRDLRSFRSHVISAVPKLVRSEITTYNEVNCAKRQNATVSDPRDALDFPDSHRIFNQHIAEHPLIGHYARSGDPRVVKMSDFLTRGKFHSVGLYTDFYRRVGVEYQMALMLPAAPPLVIGIALNRGRPDFTEHERLLLNLIRPHLVQAYENATAVTTMAEKSAAGMNAVDHLGRAAIVVTRHGRVRLISTVADQLFARYFGSRRTGGLPECIKSWMEHQYSLLASMKPPVPLIVNREKERLIVRMLSDCDQVLLHLTEQVTAICPQALQAQGLTTRESEVLAWVARGKTNSEVATILSVRLRTVKKHMERIFQKLGVESRTAAAVRVWESHGLKDPSDQSLGVEHFISCARCGAHVHAKACA